jgi:hypothetical protein
MQHDPQRASADNPSANDQATRALILGILALALNFINAFIGMWPFIGLLAIPGTLAALICSVMAIQRGSAANKLTSGQSSAAMGAVVLGILTVPFGLSNVIMCILGLLQTLVLGGLWLATPR